jgi:hypothetical protein
VTANQGSAAECAPTAIQVLATDPELRSAGVGARPASGWVSTTVVEPVANAVIRLATRRRLAWRRATAEGRGS